MSDRWGATPEEWYHFAKTLGLLKDLLPVVSNPDAEISELSKLAATGKTPSVYNKDGKVAGIRAWTGKEATARDIKRWAQQPDYGICVQTRHLRAIDIDVEDEDVAASIVSFIDEFFLGIYSFPRRYRTNSSKCLLPVYIEGEIPKRKMAVAGGLVEFLGNGQQFIAAGTHPSGARYQWDRPVEPVTLSLEDFNKLWDNLAHEFAIEAPTEGALRKDKGETLDKLPEDTTADWLEARGHVLDRGPEGQLFIECPFSDEHTTDSGESSTAYFPAGTRGYEQGHFVCLHAHCTGRTDDEYIRAFGIIEDDFQVVEHDPGSELPLPPFRRNQAGGILAVVENVRMALERPDFCGLQIRFDEFCGDIMVAAPGTTRAWRPLVDTDYFALRLTLENRGFKPVGREMVRDAVHFVANDNKFDSAQEWLNGLEWDGVKRIDRFAERYLGAVGDEYSRNVSAYLWTALAGRVCRPGIKADMVPIFEGLQGTGKSTLIASLVPSPEFFCEVSFHESDADLARKMKGCLVAEIAELRGLHTRELEGIKAFVTRTHEKWVPKYQERAVTYARRVVFIGTTNQRELLADATGNRRWLPLNVTKCDVQGIRADRLQLWAEGRVRFEKNGIEWEGAEATAVQRHEEYRMENSWEEAIARWLSEPDLDGIAPEDRDIIQVVDVAREALNLRLNQLNRAAEMKIAAALRQLGYERHRTSKVRGWRKAG